MRSQRSIVRKAAKRRAQRKDFVYRKHINANVPTIVVAKKRELLENVMINGRQVFNGDKSPKRRVVGEKIVYSKEKVYRFTDPANPKWPRKDEYNREVGMISYPKIRKHLTKVTN